MMNESVRAVPHPAGAERALVGPVSRRLLFPRAGGAGRRTPRAPPGLPGLSAGLPGRCGRTGRGHRTGGLLLYPTPYPAATRIAELVRSRSKVPAAVIP